MFNCIPVLLCCAFRECIGERCFFKFFRDRIYIARRFDRNESSSLSKNWLKLIRALMSSNENSFLSFKFDVNQFHIYELNLFRTLLLVFFEFSQFDNFFFYFFFFFLIIINRNYKSNFALSFVHFIYILYKKYRSRNDTPRLIVNK